MLRWLIDLPRWLFLGALVYAPWAYGSTPIWTIRILNALLAVIVLLWLAGAWLRKRMPSVPLPMVIPAALILLQGWIMALYPSYRETGGYHLSPVARGLSWLPGSVDGAISVTTMLRITCLLGIACFAADLSFRKRWRKMVWRVIAATGITLVLFGLFQSASAKPLLFWRAEDMTIPLFATYYYAGNAGAFINLVLPLVAGLAALTLRKPDAHLSRVLWLPGFFVCTAGAFVNPSRFAMVLTALLCLILLAWQFTTPDHRDLLPPRRLRFAYAGLMMAALLFLVTFSGWERPSEKWALLRSQLNSTNSRLVSARICVRMLPDAGWHGFGPGTFELVFPHYTDSLGKIIPGIWRYAHNDYLQTLIEWGWLGAIPWALLFFGAVTMLFVSWRKRAYYSTSDRVLLFTSLLSLSGIAIHSLIDFPLQIASLQLYAATLVGFGWGSRFWKQTSKATPRNSPITTVGTAGS